METNSYNSGQNKRQKTIDSYFSGESSVATNDMNFKEELKKLIETNDTSISLKTSETMSDNWKRFKKVLKDNKETDYVLCNECQKLIKYNSKIGTNSMTRHKCKKEIVINNETIDRHLVKPLKNINEIKTSLANSLILFSAKDLKPISTVNALGFKQLAQELINIGSKYPYASIDNILPSHQCVSNHLITVYNKIKERLLFELNNVEVIGITCDHWSYSKTKVNFITITAQYIKQTQVFTRILCTIPTTDKKAKTIQNDLNSVLNEFKINDKTLYYVTDNASSMLLAFSEESHFSCAAHNINLVHKHSFEEIEKTPELNQMSLLIENSKNLVKYFNHSDLQNQLKTTLKQSIPIRWDSKYVMLESIKHNYSEIKELGKNNGTVMEKILNINELLLDNLIDFLKPFYDLRLTLCQEKSPIFHLVLPTKQKMLVLCKPLNSDSYMFRKIRKIYAKNIKQYFKTTDLHSIGVILFPLLKNINNLLSNEEKQNSIDLLKSLAEKQLHENNTEFQITSTMCEMNIDLCLKDFVSSCAFSQKFNDSNIEVQNYLDSTFKYSSDFSIFKYWDENKVIYPRLYKLSKELSLILATNLSSERNFNYAGLTLSDKRSRLDPQNVDKLLFIRSNFDLS